MVRQKQKQQIDGWFLYVHHILGQEKSLYWKTRLLQVTVCSRLVTTMSCSQRLLCILTSSGMPKTEATNWRLVSKCTAHIRWGKSLQLKTRILHVTVYSRLVTTISCSKMFLCILTLSGMIKTEATNWQLVSKCTAHIRWGKSLHRLLCILDWLLVSCSKRFLCILTWSGMPKMEAKNWRLVFICTALIRLEKPTSMYEVFLQVTAVSD